MDDWTLLKCLKEDRQIYAIKVVDYQVHQDVEKESSNKSGGTVEGDHGDCEGDAVVPTYPSNNENLMDSNIQSVDTDFQSCVICMEDLPSTELKQHNACDCVMCLPCLERTIEHHMNYESDSVPKNHIKCPGCRQEAEASVEFVTLDQIGKKNLY